MTISTKEFNNNFEKYLDIASKEEVLITKNGKPIVKMEPYEKTGLSYLRGLLKNYTNEDDSMDNREIKWERINLE